MSRIALFTVPDGERPHVCGRCRTPWGVYNAACPNRPLAYIEDPSNEWWNE